MKSKAHHLKRLGQYAMAGLITGLSGYASANDFSLVNNSFVIKNGSTDIATATLSSNGILQTTSLPVIEVNQTTLNSGLPSFTFTLGRRASKQHDSYIPGWLVDYR